MNSRAHRRPARSAARGESNFRECRRVTGSHRVALVASSFAPHIGGVETHVGRLAAGLRERGTDVEVWTVDRGEGTGVREADGVRVRVLPAPLPSMSPGGIWRFAQVTPGAWKAWTQAYRAFRPTVLNVHCFGPNGVFALAVCRRFGVPLILTSHGETFMDDHGIFDTSTVLRTALRIALARADGVSAPSQAVLDDLTSRFGLRGGVVIPNGVDLRIHPSADRHRESAAFFAVGRLVMIKGFDLLLEAFARTRNDRASLVIGGDGPERDALAAQARRLGLDDRVSFPGWLDEQAIADAMGSATAVIVPSRIEAFGIVALEAWRAGAPLIMTRHGGATGFMNDGVDAVLVDPQDADGFAAAIDRVDGDEALRNRLAAAGSSRVMEYGWESVLDRYESLLSSPMPR